MYLNLKKQIDPRKYFEFRREPHMLKAANILRDYRPMKQSFCDLITKQNKDYRNYGWVPDTYYYNEIHVK